MAEDIIIRRVIIDDTEPIRRVQAESWLATYPSDENGVSYEWVKNRVDRWLTAQALEESRGYVLAAINDQEGFYRLAQNGQGEVVGFIHLSTKDSGLLEFEAIYTRPDMFGSGLGHKLMAPAMAWAGNKEIALDVASYNKRAIRFYEKYGFATVLGSESLYYGVIPAVRMIKGAAKREARVYEAR